jgi:outer membrane protein assembly factor BamB
MGRHLPPFLVLVAFTLAFDVSPVRAFLDSGGLFSRPATGADGSVYVGTRKAQIFAFHPQPKCVGGSNAANVCTTDAGCPGGTCSRIKWVFQAGNNVQGDPAIAPPGTSAAGTIYAGSSDGNTYAFDPDPDAECLDADRMLSPGCVQWVLESGAVTSRAVIRPAAGGLEETLFMGGYDWRSISGQLLAIDLTPPSCTAEGKHGVCANDVATCCARNADCPGSTCRPTLRWKTAIPGRLRFNLLLAPDQKTIYVGSKSVVGGLYAVADRSTSGEVIWQFDAGVEGARYNRGGDVGPDGTIYAASERAASTRIVALAPAARACSNDGRPCRADADCLPGGSCQSPMSICTSGTNEGQSCTTATDCPLGTCERSPCAEVQGTGACGSVDQIQPCGFCVRWFYDMRADQRSAPVLSLEGTMVLQGSRMDRSTIAPGRSDNIHAIRTTNGTPDPSTCYRAGCRESLFHTSSRMASIAAIHPGGRPQFSPFDVMTGAIFIGDLRGNFYAIAPCTPGAQNHPACVSSPLPYLQKIWSLQTDFGMRNSPGLAQDGNTVYVGNDTRGGGGATFYAFDVDTGDLRWCYDTQIRAAAPNGLPCANPEPDRPACCKLRSPAS